MPTTTDTIPVFFSSDDNYLPFLAVSMRSLIDNLSPGTRCDIHILNSGLNPSRARLLLEMATDTVRVHLVDVSRQIAPLTEQLNLRDYYTASIYFRLFIPSLFPQYHKAIYLDADIADNGDLSRLYRIPLGSRLLGAVPDGIIASHRDFREYAELGLGIPYRRYFNSGVLLMNLDQFRMQQIERKFVCLLNTYHFDTVCPDQDYLNVLCRGQVLYLDQGWNKMSIDECYPGTPDLVHYNMFYKPWQYRSICYQEYFWKYAAATPFYEEIRRMQRAFGWKERYGHMTANRALHRNARRISRADNNFRCVLSGGTASAAPEWSRAYEA